MHLGSYSKISSLAFLHDIVKFQKHWKKAQVTLEPEVTGGLYSGLCTLIEPMYTSVLDVEKKS